MILKNFVYRNVPTRQWNFAFFRAKWRMTSTATKTYFFSLTSLLLVRPSLSAFVSSAFIRNNTLGLYLGIWKFLRGYVYAKENVAHTSCRNRGLNLREYSPIQYDVNTRVCRKERSENDSCKKGYTKGVMRACVCVRCSNNNDHENSFRCTTPFGIPFIIRHSYLSMRYVATEKFAVLEKLRIFS